MTVRALAVGDTCFPFHDFDEVAPTLVDVLDDADVAVTTTTDAADLRDLTGYDVVVDFTTDSWSIPDDAVDELRAFVRNGGGYAGIHCAADLTSERADDPEDVIDAHDEPVPALREMLGGHFLGHPEQQDERVEIAAVDDPITDGVGDFTVFDEPYEVDWDEDVRVLARMDVSDLDPYPVVWTKPYGDGRVFYCSLGHTEDAWTSEEFRTLVRRGVRWAAGDD